MGSTCPISYLISKHIININNTEIDWHKQVHSIPPWPLSTLFPGILSHSWSLTILFLKFLEIAMLFPVTGHLHILFLLPRTLSPPSAGTLFLHLLYTPHSEKPLFLPGSSQWLFQFRSKPFAPCMQVCDSVITMHRPQKAAWSQGWCQCLLPTISPAVSTAPGT